MGADQTATAELSNTAKGQREISQMALARLAIKYGSDGRIPDSYKANIASAVKPLITLVSNHKFNLIFVDTIKILGKTRAPPDAYLRALTRMKLNLADTTKTPRIAAEIQADTAAIKQDPTYRPPTAYSIPDGPNVWLRDFLLKAGNVRDISGTILHELTHVAGAPANQLAEIALDRIHKAAGISRVQ